MWNILGNILNKLGIVFICCVVIIGISHTAYVQYSDSQYAVCNRITDEIDNVESRIRSLNNDLIKYNLGKSDAYDKIQTIVKDKYKEHKCEEAKLW